MKERKIVACSYCKVKKYNFDMIEKFPNGSSSSSNLYCSLNCLGLSGKPSVSHTPIQPRSATLPVISARKLRIRIQADLGQHAGEHSDVLQNRDVAGLGRRAT